jgi:long-subunit fatty acid transport protein
MSKMSIGNKTGNLRSKVLLGVLVLAVMVGLSSGLYASSANISADNSLSGQTSIFDPFNLTRTAPATLRTPFRPVLTSNIGDMKTFILLGEKTTLIKTMPTVRISSRPVLRTFYRPSFIF